MAPVATKRLVAVALIGNATAAFAKIAAYAMTGSSALLSEAIHSLVAVTHQTLMLFGYNQAARPGDARHAFGYAKEIYFWSFVAAVLLFSHGAGVAIYEGIQKIKSPPFLAISPIAYWALLLALAVQIAVIVMLMRGRSASPNAVSPFAETRDAMRGALAIETLAATAGILIALAGIFATDVLGVRYGDALASLGVGFVMAALAALMCLRIRTLLVGAAADPGLRSRLRVLFASEMGTGRPLAAVHDIKTLQLGPDDVLVAANVAFHDGETARSVEDTTTRLDRSIKAEAPEVSHVFLALQPPDGSDEMADAPLARSVTTQPQPQPHPATAPMPAPAPGPPRAPQSPTSSHEGSRKSRKKKRRH
jgi:cation diffusion facilitator family transporter